MNGWYRKTNMDHWNPAKKKNESQERGWKKDVAGDVVNESVRRLRLRPVSRQIAAITSELAEVTSKVTALLSQDELRPV